MFSQSSSLMDELKSGNLNTNHETGIKKVPEETKGSPQIEIPKRNGNSYTDVNQSY